MSEDPGPAHPAETAPEEKGSEETALERRGLLTVVALGGAVALAHLLQYLALPFLEAPLYDSTVYLGQAAAARAGDFGNATLLAFSPLYGYFLAAAGAPGALIPAILCQLAVHLSIVAGIHRFAARRYGLRAGLAAALLYIGYGIPLFYATKHLSETLGLALGFAFFGLYLSARFRDGDGWAGLATGVVAGLMVLARASLLFTLPFIVLTALLPWRRIPGDAKAAARRQRPRRTAALVAGLALVLGGNGLWNYSNTSFFVPVIMVSDTVSTSVGAEVQGNLSAFSTRDDGGVSPWDVVDQAARRIAVGPSGRADGGAAGGFDLAGLGSLLSTWLSGAPGKVVRTFSDLELTFYQYGYYGERQELTLLRATPVTFGSLLLLALAGAAFLVRRRGFHALLPYLPLVAGVLATTTLFHPSTRYRLALLVPAVFLAGYAIDAVSRLQGRRRMLVAGPLLAVCLFFAGRTVTYELRQPAVWELSVAESAALVPDPPEVLRRIQRARALAGDDPGIEARIRYVEGRLARRLGAAGRAVPPP